MDASRMKGFTLVELVVVIVIIGVLSAFAVPHLTNLDSSARAATIQSLGGSVRTAASLARGMSMAVQNSSSVTMEGNAVSLVNRYPDATAAGIALAVNTTSADFAFTPGTTALGVASWNRVGALLPAACAVSYQPPTVAGALPTVTVTTLGC